MLIFDLALIIEGRFSLRENQLQNLGKIFVRSESHF